MDLKEIVRKSCLHVDMAATRQPESSGPLLVAVLSQEQNLASPSCSFHTAGAAGQRSGVTGSIGWLPLWLPRPHLRLHPAGGWGQTEVRCEPWSARFQVLSCIASTPHTHTHTHTPSLPCLPAMTQSPLLLAGSSVPRS